MSSILKALQKLETNRGDRPGKTEAVVAGPGVHRPASFLRRLRFRILSGLFVSALIAIGWVWGRSPLSTFFSKPIIAPLATVDSPKPMGPAPRQPATPQRSPMPEPLQSAATKTPVNAEAQTPLALPEERQSRKQETIPPSFGGAMKEKAPASPPKSSSESLSSPPSDTGMKLEALFWAPVPERRMVVINSQILKEGDYIGSSKVEHIEQEQVVLRKDGRLWQLRHRSQK